jgi:hypothetical protein
MKITQAHLDFWRLKKCPTPSWAKALKYPDGSIGAATIHYLVNRAAGWKLETDASNTLAILRSVRQREGMTGVRQWLWKMGMHPGTVIRPDRRAAYCAKWYKRLTGGSTVWTPRRIQQLVYGLKTAGSRPYSGL